jgi:hypothetical protein
MNSGEREPVYAVVAAATDVPTGGREQSGPLLDLTGKTICELWDGVFKGDAMFPIIRSKLKDRFQGLRFVEYSSFDNVYADRESEVIAELPTRLREMGCDAVIAGVGG